MAYSVTEKECMSVLHHCEKFRNYLVLRRFTVITDHQALLWLARIDMTGGNARLIRWKVRLMDFDFDIVYREGSRNVLADAMTRPPVVVANFKAEVERVESETIQRLRDELRQELRQQIENELRGEQEDRLQAARIMVVTRTAGVRKENVQQRAIQRRDARDTTSTLARSSSRADTQHKDALDQSQNHQRDEATPARPARQEVESEANVTEVEEVKVSEFRQQVKDVREEIEREQRKDHFCSTLIEFLETKRFPKDKAAREIVETHQHLVLMDGEILTHLWWPVKESELPHTRRQLVVPMSMTETLMTLYHDSIFGGHLAAEQTFRALREKYWWPSMYADVRKYVEECHRCQSMRNVDRSVGLLRTITPAGPFDIVGMDVLGPFGVTARGNRYILVIQDYFTKWPEAIPLRDQKASTIASAFVQLVVCRHSSPRRVITDQGANFMSQFMDSVLSLTGVRHDFATPYHQQTNGLVERFNRTLLAILNGFISENQENWDTILPLVLAAYRQTAHSSTGISPFFCLYGYEPRKLVDWEWQSRFADIPKHADLLLDMKRARKIALDNIKKAQEVYKRNYDGKHKDVSFAAGDVVLLFTPVSTGSSAKFVRPWKGPYRVTSFEGVNARIVHVNNPSDQQFVHVQRLKHFLGDPGSLEEGEFHIKAILDSKIENGKKYYFVQWTGYSKRDDCWVAEEDIEADRLIAEFKLWEEVGRTSVSEHVC
jgi:hypothetical protein